MMLSAGEHRKEIWPKKKRQRREIPVRIGSVDIVKEMDDFEKTW